MKVLLLNGSPHENGCVFTALSEAAASLQKHGVETEIFQLGKDAVHGCIACRACVKLKKCVFDDVCNRFTERAAEADGFIFGSPVYYGSANGALCAVLDRAFFSAGRAFAGKPGAAAVSCRRGGAGSAFDRLNKYFTINQMPIVSSQYWNDVHGSCADDVKKDAEGLQTMRVLGANMAALLCALDADKDAARFRGEQKIFTNFIR